MRNHDFKALEGKKKGLFMALLVIFSLFLLSLTVSTIVGIQNKIKEGRYIGKDIQEKDTITVFDTGEVYVKPDLTLTTFSVITEAKVLKDAMDENTEKMSAVIDFVKSQGVEGKDLKTTSFYIYPRYEWYEKGTCVPACPLGKRVLVGYEVQQSLQVKIRDMEKIGEIIQGATDAGANQVGDLQFTVDNQDELKKQARELAIEKAKVKAEELASQLGISLIRIISFNESGTVPYYYLSEKGLGGAEAESPQIETGENKISVTVTITYEIN